MEADSIIEKKLREVKAKSFKDRILQYKGQTHYKFKTHGIAYDLPLVMTERNLYILWLNTLGETRLVSLCAKALAKKLPKFDTLVTMEPYGIQFAHALSVLLGKNKFVVCRTEKYSYMKNQLREYWGPKNNIKSAVFYLDGRDAEFIKGKRVILVDEIVGERRAMNAMERLVEKAGGKIVYRVAMFCDGKAYPDITCFDILPIFIK